MIEEIFVQNVIQYLEAISDRYAKLFRGVSKKNYSLVPSVGRDFNEFIELTPYEIKILNQFREETIPFVDSTSKSDLEMLMLAQHYGMQTRLLDWTTNPLVALYFACEKDYNDDGKVFRLDTIEHLNIDKSPDPFKIQKDYAIRPRHISPRIAAQSAYFTISSDPRRPLELTATYHNFGNYHNIIVPRQHKVSIVKELSNLGINPATLFPGLEGVSRKLDFEIYFMKETLKKSLPLSDTKSQ